MIDVFWWSKRKIENSEKENFGDFLVPYLLEKTTNEMFQWVRPNSNRKFLIIKKKHFLIIGSVLGVATRHSVVWGAGIIKSSQIVKKATFYAVRGPLTRKRLLELGCNVPEYYGDPAILVAIFNRKRKSKSYCLGVVPHFVDHDVAEKTYKGIEGVKVINLLTNNPQEVIDEISACSYIISSSLHGLIVAHSLGVPALWTRISTNLHGDDIKFADYYMSMGIENFSNIPFLVYTPDEIQELFEKFSSISYPSRENLDKRIKDLIQTFPFKKSQNFKDAIASYFVK